MADAPAIPVGNDTAAFSIRSFHAEQEQTLIVYGTADELPTNREAAQALQKALRENWQNITIPIKSDKEVTEAELKSHHLLLIGRPDSNSAGGALPQEPADHLRQPFVRGARQDLRPSRQRGGRRRGQSAEQSLIPWL